MPELPEVETVKKQLQASIINKPIQSVQLYSPKLRYAIELPPLGAVITHIERRAKYIVCFCEYQKSTYYWIIHLGMTGYFQHIYYSSHYFNQPKLKHSHFDIYFKDSVLRYIDARRFGVSIYTEDNYTHHSLIKNLGVEPLSVTVENLADYLYKQAQKRKQNIKLFLTNNTIVVGVGNIYACEILFCARVHPNTLCNGLGLAKYTFIAQHIQRILQQAIEMGGSQIDNFQHVQIYQQDTVTEQTSTNASLDNQQSSAYFQIQHQVYARQHKPCAVCGSAISRIMQGQRSSYFCATCQV